MSPSAPELKVNVEGARYPEQEHQQLAENVQGQLAQAGITDAQTKPITPDTHLEITEQKYQVVTPETGPALVKDEPKRSGWSKFWERFINWKNRWFYGRPGTTDSGAINQKQVEYVVAQQTHKEQQANDNPKVEL